MKGRIEGLVQWITLPGKSPLAEMFAFVQKLKHCGALVVLVFTSRIILTKALLIPFPCRNTPLLLIKAASIRSLTLDMKDLRQSGYVSEGWLCKPPFLSDLFNTVLMHVLPIEKNEQGCDISCVDRTMKVVFTSGLVLKVIGVSHLQMEHEFFEELIRLLPRKSWRFVSHLE